MTPRSASLITALLAARVRMVVVLLISIYRRVRASTSVRSGLVAFVVSVILVALRYFLWVTHTLQRTRTHTLILLLVISSSRRQLVRRPFRVRTYSISGMETLLLRRTIIRSASPVRRLVLSDGRRASSHYLTLIIIVMVSDRVTLLLQMERRQRARR